MHSIHQARLVIETQSALSLCSGERDLGADTAVARDASGLPYLPATSLAGVWLHLSDANLQARWFGSCEQSGRLRISHGLVLNAQGQAVQPLTSPRAIEQDPLLNFISKTFKRERVRLNANGVAEDTGKFDLTFLPRGLRFVVNLEWQAQANESEADLKQQWAQLLALWQDPFFRLGSHGRMGHGKIRLLGFDNQSFALHKNPSVGAQIEAYQKQPLPMTLPEDLSQLSNDQDSVLIDMPLKALDTWRYGQGTLSLQAEDTSVSQTNFVYSEEVITWNKDHSFNKAVPQAFLCGSSIKGMLVHRLAYHYRVQCQQWAETIDSEDFNQVTIQNQTDRATDIDFYELVGCTETHPSNKNQASLLWVEDSPVVYAPHQIIKRTYNKIDRFTGGVIGGALFTEELLEQPQFRVRVLFKKRNQQKQHSIQPDLMAAMQSTFDDLRQGRLPIGAGGGRGHSLVVFDTANAASYVYNPSLLSASDEESWSCN
jgi:CRISPR/Cas system CMR subunit Cmr4 (Cas7 group RAMP superfamily)